MSSLVRVHFFCDGSIRDYKPTSKGIMGCGVVGVQPPHYQEWSIPLGMGTSQIAELLAVREALKLIRDRSRHHVVVTTDSQYAIGALTGGWCLKKNLEVIAQVVPLIAECGHFEMEWVRGHDGHPYNEIAHRLASRATGRK